MQPFQTSTTEPVVDHGRDSLPANVVGMKNGFATVSWELNGMEPCLESLIGSLGRGFRRSRGLHGRPQLNPPAGPAVLWIFRSMTWLNDDRGV
jgi:hypothetical protein